MKLLLSHPTGNANVRAALEGFLEANMLVGFRTSIASFQGNFLDRLSSFRLLSEIRRRRFSYVLNAITKTSPWKESGRLISAKAGFSSLTKHEKGFFSVDAVYKSIDKKTASELKTTEIKCLTAVYAYEDAAEYSFTSAKQFGIKCIYDLPIGYWRASLRILEQEKERWPEWVDTLPGLKDSPDKLKRKDAELKLADKIYVASSFTAKTLEDFPGKLADIEIIPYGFPPANINRVYTGIERRSLRLLYVGSLTQRKGIANLLSAVDEIGNHIELTIIGSKMNNNCTALNNALKKHKWIPSLSNQDILKIMGEHDVLIFPSLFEGFGLVITEAMAQGTPVITTDRTAGPDFILDDFNGWIINAGSTEAIIKSLEKILSDKRIIKKTGKEAKETAKKRPWKVYGEELAKSVMKV